MNQLVRHEPSVVGILNRSEMEGQIDLARSYPRDLEVFDHYVRSLALRSIDIASECVYAVPRDGKLIEGPSVRFAEILASGYRNIRHGARVIEEAEDHIVAQAVFLDLETNSQTTFETRRRIVTKTGKRYSSDMINTTANAACAIALRQAVLKGIPRPIWGPLFEETKRMAIPAEQLPALRQQAIKAFAGLGVDQARLFRALEVESIDAIDRDAIAKLKGVYAAIKEGEATIDDAFPVQRPAAAPGAKPRTMEEFAGDVTSIPDAYELGRSDRRQGMDARASETWPEAVADAYRSGYQNEAEAP